MIIEARIEDNSGGSEPIRLVDFERTDGELKQLGLSLAEGKSLVSEAQRALVNAQAHGFVVASRTCLQCGATLSIKAKHTIQYRTVFGKVTIDSPQLRVCKCSQDTSGKSFSPLALALSRRVSPELEYLQVKWAAHLPYAVATALLKETLPVDQAISTSGVRNRVWAVGQELDDAAEKAIRGERAYPPANSEVTIVALAKKRQMRWTNKGAHLLVQVRVAVLNGELKMRDMPDRRRTVAEQKRDDHWQCVA